MAKALTDERKAASATTETCADSRSSIAVKKASNAIAVAVALLAIARSWLEVW
jgi:hypothetical protein